MVLLLRSKHRERRHLQIQRDESLERWLHVRDRNEAICLLYETQQSRRHKRVVERWARHPILQKSVQDEGSRVCSKYFSCDNRLRLFSLTTIGTTTWSHATNSSQKRAWRSVLTHWVSATPLNTIMILSSSVTSSHTLWQTWKICYSCWGLSFRKITWTQSWRSIRYARRWQAIRAISWP